MHWKKITIGKKNVICKTNILTMLIAITAISYFGVGTILSNADEVISGKELDKVLAQREVDHLHWAQAVNILLTDASVTTLNVQTDHKKCKLGSWLYGEGRTEAEQMLPGLQPLLKGLESPHERMHSSGMGHQITYRHNQ
jgi:methyl-accepting chemotaxis protein